MPNVTHTDSTEITIRAARAEDMGELARVAARDTHDLPEGRLLVAKVGSSVRAAISLDDGTIIADPFHRTAELVEALRLKVGHIDGRPGGSRRGLLSRLRGTAAAKRALPGGASAAPAGPSSAPRP